MEPVLDVACGFRGFYFDKNDPRVLKCDKNPQHMILCDGRTLDPPHLKSGAGWQVKKYGKLDKYNFHDDLKRGFEECLRVLKPNGTLVFKWNECQIPLKEILPLCPAKPIIGNRRPNQSKTHWILFIKEEG